MAVTVALAEDNLIVRTGIAQLLVEHEAGIEVVSQCDDFDSLLEAIDRDAPDVVLTDIRMPPDVHRRGAPRRGRAARAHRTSGS